MAIVDNLAALKMLGEWSAYVAQPACSDFEVML